MISDLYFSSVNGVESSNLHVSDRGLAYGDGLFETMRVHKGEIPLLSRHLHRLKSGCEKLLIPYQEQNIRAFIKSILASALSANTESVLSGVLKLIVTRGRGGKGYAAPVYEQVEPQVILQYSHNDLRSNNDQSGVALHICQNRLSSNKVLAGIKHLNRLEYVLAAQGVPSGEINQGLLLDDSAHAIETLHHNLFLVKAGRVVTPVLDLCGVTGVMRAVILEQICPSMKVSTAEAKVSLDDLNEADEVFISNSVRGVWHVATANSRLWSKGPITQDIQNYIARIWSNS